MAIAVGRWRLALVAFGGFLAFVSSARADDVPVSATAARRFEEGVRYLRSQDPDRYEKAYREFRAAYADSPSWKILGNLGIVAQELERDGEAIDAYEGYLKGGGKELSAEERKQFENDLELLQSGLMTLQIRTVPEGAWIVDERLPESGAPIINRYGPTQGPLELRVRAGHHRVHAELGGHSAKSWELSEPAGASVAHVFELRPNDAPEAAIAPEPTPVDVGVEARGGGSWRTLSYVSLGLGAVGLGVGTWFFLDIDDKERVANDAHAACSADAMRIDDCPEPREGVGSEIYPTLFRTAWDANSAEKRTRTLSVVGFAAGGALLATGVVLWLVAPDEDATEEQSARFIPWIGPGSAGLSGTF